MKTMLALLTLTLAGCSRGAPGPAALDTRNDVCAQCRMMVSDARFAAQVVAPGEEPLFFDDLGCLRSWLSGHPELSPKAAVYVADHRTKAWVPAASATYTRVPGLQTPMNSGLVAHESPASRATDPAAAKGTPVAATEIVGGGGR